MKYAYKIINDNVNKGEKKVCVTTPRRIFNDNTYYEEYRFMEFPSPNQ